MNACLARMAVLSLAWVTAGEPAPAEAIRWVETTPFAPNGGAWFVVNPAAGVHGWFLADGPRFAPAAQASPWTWGLRLASVARGADVHPTADRLAWARAGTSLGCRFGSVEERYHSDGRGIEHVIELHERPGGSAADRVELRFAVLGGLKARVRPDAAGAAFADAQGRERLSYSGLKVWDAVGRALPAGMAGSGTDLRIWFEDHGAAYPVVVDPFVTSLRQSLSPPEPANQGRFGKAVAVHGDLMVVGEPEGNSKKGVAWVYTRNEFGDWVGMAPGGLPVRLSVTEGAAGDEFGAAVSIVATVVIVGAPGRDQTGVDSGAVYAFHINGPTASLLFKAVPTNGTAAAGNRFGAALAQTPALLAVGAPGDDVGSFQDAGSVYVFRGCAGVPPLCLEAHLTGNGVVASAKFGTAIALGQVPGSAKEVCIVGAPDNVLNQQKSGTAYVFHGQGGTWSQVANLSPQGDGINQQNARFGTAMALAWPHLIIGAPGALLNSQQFGAFYPFIANAGGSFAKDVTGAGALTAQFASVPAKVDDFGAAVDVTIHPQHGVIAAIGAPLRDSTELNAGGQPLTLGNTGAAYVFRRRVLGTKVEWHEERRVQLDGGDEGDNFGRVVRLDDTRLIGSTPDADGAAANMGRVHVHEVQALGGVNSFQIGGTLVGRLASTDEVDRWVFYGRKGWVVDIDLEATEAGQDFHPHMTLWNDDTGLQVSIDDFVHDAQSPNPRLLNFELPETCRYRLEISAGLSASGAGDYRASTTRAVPKKKASDPKKDVQPGQEETFTFDAVPGSIATINLKKSQPNVQFRPTIVNLLDPKGGVVNHVPYLIDHGNQAVKSQEIKKLPIGQLGTYTLVVKNTGAEPGGFTYILTLKETKVEKGTWREGFDLPVERTAALLTQTPTAKKPAGALRSLQSALGRLYDLVREPANAHDIAERSLTTALKPFKKGKGKGLQNLWSAIGNAGAVASLAEVPSVPAKDFFDVNPLSDEVLLAPTPRSTVVYLVGHDRHALASVANTLQNLHRRVADADLEASIDMEFRAFLTHSPAEGDAITYAAISLAQEFGPLTSLHQLLSSVSGEATGWDVLGPLWAETYERIGAAAKASPAAFDAAFRSAFPDWTQGLLHTVGSEEAVQLRQLSEMVKQDLASGVRVVLVAHSRGNNYVSNALNQIGADDPFDTLLLQVGVVAVGYPSVAYTNLLHPPGRFAAINLHHDPVAENTPKQHANFLSDLAGEPCSTCSMGTADETNLEEAAVHSLDLSYLGFTSSAIRIAEQVLEAHAKLPKLGLPLLGQGALQITLTLDDSAVPCHLEVIEPDGTRVDDANPSGVGYLEGKPTPSEFPRENYFVPTTGNLVPGKYRVIVRGVAGGSEVKPYLWIRAVNAFMQLAPAGLQAGGAYEVATVQYKADGTASIKATSPPKPVK